ncbi:MAG: AraC family transcriptional regulator [Pseudomonadota bacterium]
MSLNSANLASFENDYALMRSGCAEEFASRFEDFHGHYSANIKDRYRHGQIGVLSVAKLGDLNFSLMRWNTGITGTVLCDQPHFCLRIPVSGRARTEDPHFGTITNGHDEIGLFRANQGVTVDSGEDNSAVNVSIPAGLLESRAESFYDQSGNHPLHFPSQVKVQSLQGTMITSLVNVLMAQLVAAPRVCDNELLLANIREYAVSAILNALPCSIPNNPAVERDSGVPRTVKLAEDYMHANAEQPVTLDQIAREAGCSERALQNAFKSFRDITPMVALREIRLCRAHRDLCEGTESVTQIALKWGFSNLGRFAALYQEKYGEKPSVSLKKYISVSNLSSQSAGALSPIPDRPCEKRTTLFGDTLH